MKNIREMDVQRRVVSYKTSQSWKEVPHVSFLYEPDVTEFYEVFGQVRDKHRETGCDVSLNTILIQAIVEGLKSALELNSYCKFDEKTYSGTIETLDQINVGIPWLLPDGKMITLTAFDLGNKTLEQTAWEIQSLRQKLDNTEMDRLLKETVSANAANGAAPKQDADAGLRPEHITGGTVTVSNIGSICRTNGTIAFLEILPPQVFAVGISALQEKPGVFVDESGEKRIGIRKTIPMCLMFDHRAFDFGDIVPFIHRLDEIFRSPKEILSW